MVLVSHRYKFIHIRNPKTAGSSVESFFAQFCIDPAEQVTYDFPDAKYTKISEYGIIDTTPLSHTTNWYTHITAADIKKLIGDDMFNNYIKFCIVRNPYDRMVSYYYWNIHLCSVNSKQNDRTPIITNFKQFCMSNVSDYKRLPRIYNWFNNNNRLLLNGQPVCDFYIRYEHLKEDIVTLLEKMGITDYDLSKLPNHKSGIRPKEKHYREYYDDETREKVYNQFKIEFDMFGYTF